MSAVFTALAAFLGSGIGVFGGHYTQRWAHRKASADQLRELRRQTALVWLGAVHEMYEQIADAHRHQVSSGKSQTDVARDLRRIPSSKAQMALEDLRLSATNELAQSAAAMWVHMRRELVPIGRDLEYEHFHSWMNRYWEKRRQFINEVRKSQGQSPLDWEKAGITQARPDENRIPDGPL